MKVLSLFDGISIGCQALKNLGIDIKEYYASEINKYAIIISKKNHPNIKHIGDIINVDGNKYKNIDLLIGGSPCQNFSFAGKRYGMITKEKIEITTLKKYLKLKKKGFKFEGQSYLFFEYARILKEIKPKYFLLENVKMVKKWQDVITNILGIQPVLINSSLLTAQNRERLYWVGKLQSDGTYKQVKIKQPQDKGILLKDIIYKKVENKYYLSKKGIIYMDGKWSGKTRRVKMKNRINGKSSAIYATHSKGLPRGVIILDHDLEKYLYSGKQILNHSIKDSILNKNNIIRRLIPEECEKLQGLPVGYTEGISNTQRYKVIGNGWTLPIIEYIFKKMLKL